MRPKVLEIAWHETQAVYSCDFQPLPPAQLKRLLPIGHEDDDKDKERERAVVAGGRSYRMATAGGDSKVRLWMIHPNIPLPNLSAHVAATGQDIAPHPPRAEYLTTLSKHTAAVNVARFSPNGQTLASAGDDGNVILWVQSDRPHTNFGESSEETEKEHWRLQKMLQVTTKHVYDLAWSPDGEFFIAGSTDNTATIWKASTGECVFALREHSHNVQGVSWDPLNEYIATQSSDRSVHVNTFLFRNGIPDVHPISRASRMELRQSRTPSVPSGSRPNMARRGSATSETGSAITSASEMPDHFPNLPTALAGSATPMTPSTSVPTTPQLAHAPNPNAGMNPPPSTTKPGSRRSSFSGSQAAGSPALSAAAFTGRGRSPSPMPQLPAIRAPPPAISQKLYGDESVTRFFRRLSFSPDGSLLMTPAGQIEDQLFKGSPMLGPRSTSQDGSEPPVSMGGPVRPKNIDAGRPTVFIYSRANLARAPIAHLPGHKTASVAIRFSPIFYDLRAHASTAEAKHVMLDREEKGPIHVSLSMPPPPPPKEKDGKKEDDKKEKEEKRGGGMGSVFDMPYRLIYAVACQDSVLLYDTQQAGPIAIFRGLHYAGFTDIAWSPDGQTLMLASSDGYCSIVVFDLAELGTVHPTQQHHRQLAAIAQNHASHAPIPAPLLSSSLSNSGTRRESFSSTPAPRSPSISTMRHSPAPTRSEREGSTSSSVMGLGPSQSLNLPLFVAPSSSSSSTDHVIPTPGEEAEMYSWRMGHMGQHHHSARSGSESSASASNMGGGGGPSSLSGPSGEQAGREVYEKRPNSAQGSTGQQDGETGGEGEQPKKKRRVVLTHLGSED